jgi:hypothetical protein
VVLLDGRVDELRHLEGRLVAPRLLCSLAHDAHGIRRVFRRGHGVEEHAVADAAGETQARRARRRDPERHVAPEGPPAELGVLEGDGRALVADALAREDQTNGVDPFGQCGRWIHGREAEAPCVQVGRCAGTEDHPSAGQLVQ